jgi:DNA-binding transcriptional regulator YbjK
MDEIDKLLSELQDEYSYGKPKSPQLNLSQNRPIVSHPSKTAGAIDNLLADVKSDFQQKDLAQELQKQEELQAEKIRQEELNAKRKEGLKQKAKEWLEQLDSLSLEGIWFERFAEGYPSKLDAAVEYLSM